MGMQLFFAGTTLSSYDLTAKTVTTLPLPANAGTGGVSAIAINPARSDEIAFATFERNIYVSQDGGRSWKQIAQAGKGISLK